MSTRISIKYGENYHVYRDCFDFSSVWLEVESSAFEVLGTPAGSTITIALPVQTALEVGLIDPLVAAEMRDDDEAWNGHLRDLEDDGA